MGKRLFDIIFATTALVALAPLMAIIVVAVRIDSGGPVFFRQIRVGRYGRHFTLLKFRSMWAAPEDPGPLLTASGDRRVTRVGALLRATKLDEIPQFWNVLRGDMSVVGPRPEVPKYVDLYPEELRDLVLSVRPGITDEASIKFRDESALLGRADDPERFYVTEIMPSKLEAYAEYARSHCLARDLSIILRTVASIVART